MSRIRTSILVFVFLVGWLASQVLTAAPANSAAKVTLEKNDQGVAVLVDGQLFTQYMIRSGSKPVLWPINGPTGKPMTRSWPIGPEEEGERADHIHQRSFWFTHEGVNGVNYWGEPRSYPLKSRAQRKIGLIDHRVFTEMKSDDDGATLVTICDWIDHEYQPVLEQHTTFHFSANDDCRTIDMTIKLKALDEDVVLEDRKDGMFGIRLASSMKVDAGHGGQIVNSEGQINKGAWGQYASWVDYHGPVAGETVGVAILWHPSNFRHPIRWHVRDYGLFAANPLAEKGFPKSDRKQGPTTIKKGDTLTLRFRTLFHRGDQEQANIADAYAKYAEE